jgi:hypothetical protein
MNEQTLSRSWLTRSVSVILTFVVVAGALAFALS